MGTITLTDNLRAEYARLYAEAEIPDDKQAAVAAAAQKILDNWSRYETVAATLGIPPHPIAIIHAMESGCDFSTHLHNGDPLTAKTVHIPAGRPLAGDPPYTWEASAMDALRLHKLDQWGDWSIPGLCYVLERYNGWGYRLYHAATKSPYLWSFTSIYTAGKYVADGKWSSTAVSQQVGAMALLIELIARGHSYPVQEAAHGTPTQDVAATPAQSAPCPVPADRLPDVPGQGDAMGQEVREGVPTGVGVGVRLSKKLCVAAAGAIVLLFGPAVGIHLSPDQTKTITDILVTYLVGQSSVDALAQISAAVERYTRGDNA